MISNNYGKNIKYDVFHDESELRDNKEKSEWELINEGKLGGNEEKGTDDGYKYWSVVTFGPSGINPKKFYRSEESARCAAQKSRNSGHPMNVRVMAHKTISLANSADISQIRDGEQVIAVY